MLTSGVAFIHLLGEAAEKLPELYPAYPALAFTLASCGVVLVLALENIMLYKHSNSTVSTMIVNTAVTKDPEAISVLIKAYFMEIAVNIHRLVKDSIIDITLPFYCTLLCSTVLYCTVI